MPYKEVKYTNLRVTEVVLGVSSDANGRTGADGAMENSLNKTFPVRRSPVLVRP
jgi:hypothetical protein